MHYKIPLQHCCHPNNHIGRKSIKVASIQLSSVRQDLTGNLSKCCWSYSLLRILRSPDDQSQLANEHEVDKVQTFHRDANNQGIELEKDKMEESKRITEVENHHNLRTIENIHKKPIDKNKN
jgi:hypothetical protein